MQRNLTVHPALIRSRTTKSFSVDVADTQDSREAGFQGVSVFDVARPLLLEWEFSSTRLLHNNNVEFDILACCVDHEGIVTQVIKLQANSSDRHMTIPCRWIVEIPETIEDVLIQEGDKIIFD